MHPRGSLGPAACGAASLYPFLASQTSTPSPLTPSPLPALAMLPAGETLRSLLLDHLALLGTRLSLPNGLPCGLPSCPEAADPELVQRPRQVWAAALSSRVRGRPKKHPEDRVSRERGL